MFKKKNSILFASIALIIINGLFFIYREKGFNFKKYFNNTEIVCNPDCIEKWTYPNAHHSSEVLAAGRKILQQKISIDKIQDDENKVIALSAWLNKKFSNHPDYLSIDDSIQSLLPLQQYYYFNGSKQFNLDCGYFQTLFAFFCTSISIPCRNIQNIQIPSGSLQTDSHVMNEVYLKKYKKWVLTDPYQNHLLILSKKDTPLSASEYLDYNIGGGKDTVHIVNQSEDGIQLFAMAPSNFKPDLYFNKNYKLFYYKETNLSFVYSVSEKIKRYVLPYSWYEIYSPLEKKNNLLFRVRQFFLFLLIGWAIFIIIGYFKKKENDRS